jgi:hypothetical protein
MAPPLQPFPLNELPQRSREYSLGYKKKIRKPQIDLETCDLYELVQYSCTTKETLASTGIGKKLECYPFVRLFRRCGEVKEMFHVETTAWEGEHAYNGPRAPTNTTNNKAKDIDVKQEKADVSAAYQEFFWSKK